MEIVCSCVSFSARGSAQTSTKTPEQASRRWLLFSALLPRQWSVATGADKELVDGKTRVRDLVIESLTLCHSAWGGLEEPLQRTAQGQTMMLMGTSI